MHGKEIILLFGTYMLRESVYTLSQVF